MQLQPRTISSSALASVTSANETSKSGGAPQQQQPERPPAAAAALSSYISHPDYINSSLMNTVQQFIYSQQLASQPHLTAAVSSAQQPLHIAAVSSQLVAAAAQQQPLTTMVSTTAPMAAAGQQHVTASTAAQPPTITRTHISELFTRLLGCKCICTSKLASV